MNTTTSIPETAPIILRMTDSLQKVYEFCAASADPLVAVLAAKGIGGDPRKLCISIAAELAHWLAVQPYLLSKDVIEVVCPVVRNLGIDGYEATDQAHTVGTAVALLLGRDPQSVRMRIAPTLGTSITGVKECENGIWRTGAKPGEQLGDAIWLGNMRATDVLSYFCFSEDLEHAVYLKVPVGLSADCEVEMAKKQEILKITGLHTSPSPLENHLSDSSPDWEAYRHSKECLFENASSYILSISSQAEAQGGSAGINRKIGQCQRLLGFVAAGELLSVEVTPGIASTWCLAWPGTLLKCRFDSNPNERYQVLDRTWMVRLSDGSILSMVGGQDIRGDVATTVPGQLLSGHPGIKSDWIARSMWGEIVFKNVAAKLKGKAPLLSRNEFHSASISVPAILAALPPGDAEAAKAMFGRFVAKGPDVSDESMVFFNLMEDGRHAQAMEYLTGKPELIEAVDNEGDTPLMKAVEARNLEMVKQLLALNANVHSAAVDGFCAIHIAARNGLTTIAQKLLDAGADIDSVTPHGWTPVMCAIQKRFEGCAKLLVRQGANLNAIGPRGTPREMAKAAGMKLV